MVAGRRAAISTDAEGRKADDPIVHFGHEQGRLSLRERLRPHGLPFLDGQGIQERLRQQIAVGALPRLHMDFGDGASVGG